MKPTGLLGHRLPLDDVDKICGKRLCLRTGRRHHQLCGRSPSGPLWTKVAEQYPSSFAARLAKAFVNGRLATDELVSKKLWMRGSRGEDRAFWEKESGLSTIGAEARSDPQHQQQQRCIAVDDKTPGVGS